GVEAKLPHAPARARSVGTPVPPARADVSRRRRARRVRDQERRAVEEAGSYKGPLSVVERLRMVDRVAHALLVRGGHAARYALPGVTVRERRTVRLDRDDLRAAVDARRIRGGGSSREVDRQQNVVAV